MQSAACVRWALALSAAASALACSSDPPATGGAGGPGSAGASSGGASTAGSSSAGASAGGSSAVGGAGTNPGGTTAAGTGGSAGGGGSGGGVGGGSAGAAAGLDCIGRTVCDDFEKNATKGGKPGAPWKLRENAGTVTLDNARAFSGNYSVKVSVTATTSSPSDSQYRQAFLNVDGAPLLPLAGNKLYGRFMIYTDRIPDKTVHWTFTHGDGPYANSGTTATYNYGGMGGLMANYYRDTKPDATDCWQTKDETFTTGKWQCVGFMFDGPNNEMRFWMGANEVSEVHVLGNQKSDATCTVKGVDGKWYAPTFKNISIGWESYQHDVMGAHDAWIDDVVLDDEPIPCP